MTDTEIANLIAREFNEKNLALTEQYLQIHQPVYENDKLKIERIVRENDIIVAYLPIKDEYFYFTVIIKTKKQEVFRIDTEPRNLVSLIFASEHKTCEELQEFTNLKYQESWNIGEKMPHRKRNYTNSGIEFYLPKEPGTFEEKLHNLLHFVQEDFKGMQALSEVSKGYVHVIIDYHSGNQLLGGHVINAALIQNMSALNLSIDFQIAAWGESFK